MSTQHQQAAGGGLGQVKWVVLGVVLLGLLGNWLLYNFAPPMGSGSAVGMLSGILAGAVIAVTAYGAVS
jgi:hypothetical protein